MKKNCLPQIPFLFMFLLTIIAHSQEKEIEEYISQDQEYKDDHRLMEILHRLKTNPLDLNRATEEDLAQLPWISPQAAAKIIDYKKKNGNFSRLDELKRLNILDSDGLKAVSTFFTVNSKTRPDIELETRHKLFTKLQPQIGYIDGTYEGNRFKAYNRIRCKTGNMQLGLLTEKDPGESRWDDHRAFHLSLNLPYNNTTLIGGNYIIEHAHGLLLWSPYRAGYSNLMLHIPKSRGVLSFLSATESSGFYGLALKTTVGVSEWSLYSSHKKLDAVVEQDSILSLSKTGLHRTEHEKSKYHRIQSRLNGIMVKLAPCSVLQCSAVWQQSRWSHPFKSDKRPPAAKNQSASVSIAYNRYPFYITTEIATRHNNLAGIAILGYQIKTFESILILRDYGYWFVNEFGQAIGDRGEHINNEKGAYLGWKWKPQSDIALSAWCDLCRHPMPSYLNPMPKRKAKWRFFVKKEYSNIDLTAKLDYKKEDCFEKVGDRWGNEEYKTLQRSKFQYRLQTDIFPTKNWSLRSRFEYHQTVRSHWHLKTQKHLDPAVLLSQAIKANIQCCEIWLQFTAFDALDYDNRFYQFERDLPGTMCIKMLYGRGVRLYSRLRLHWKKQLQFTLKYESTFYDHCDSIGSGADKTDQPFENAVSFQIDWRLR